mmetsp:Transcript_23906/g.35697  ORF Transcript_23906/g.35697 Transcript_23906/m.35697 type:complete len:369 (-) Transcript_23906:167-1273(-)
MMLNLKMLVIFTMTNVNTAFVIHHPPSQQTTTTQRFLTKQEPTTTTSSLKKTGGGIPSVPSGELRLFDPNEEGKLSGTNNLQDRILNGAQYNYATYLHPGPTGAVAAPPPQDATLLPAQHFLEHLDQDGALPLNFAKPIAPATATLLGRTRIIADDAPGDIQHIIMRLPTGFHYVEGQSLSVIPPGVDPKNGRAHKPRLYSIASTRYGDVLDGNTVSLCVRRAEYYDPVSGLVDPTKKGVCSNFLCDAEAGAQIDVAGPVGKTMLLPKDPNADIIMVATGTGIAPFRGFLHRLFMEQTVAGHLFSGKVWLVLGVPTTGGLLYKEEFDAMMKNAGPDQLRIDYAISREQFNTIDGGKRYVQHVIAEKCK